MKVMEDTVFLLINSRDLAMGVAALLLSVPPLRTVERVASFDGILERLRHGRRPALVVLDTDKLGPHTAAVVESVQHVSPETRCLVFSDSVAEQRTLASSGVDAVVKGLDPRGLVGAIEHLLGEGAPG
jgi:response regulator RpfG family c-di-GMP phosphodiesterase